MSQADLFGKATPAKGYELHEHTFTGDGKSGTFEHSHEDGSEPHQHPSTGPAAYTIDKAEWLRMTGVPLSKEYPAPKFTPKPTGNQLSRVELEEWQRSFEIHVGPNPPGLKGQGGGMFTAARMILTFRMTVSNVIPFPGRKRASA